MKLIINSPLDYTNHIQSLMNKYSISLYKMSKNTGLSYNTISRIQNGTGWRLKGDYYMATDTFDKIIRYIQQGIQEDIEIVYTYSEQKNK